LILLVSIFSAALERECTSLKRLQHLYASERGTLVREEAVLLHMLQLTDPAGNHVAAVSAQVAAAAAVRARARETRAAAFEREGAALSYFNPAYASPLAGEGEAEAAALAAAAVAEAPDGKHSLESALAARAMDLAAAGADDGAAAAAPQGHYQPYQQYPQGQGGQSQGQQQQQQGQGASEPSQGAGGFASIGDLLRASQYGQRGGGGGNFNNNGGNNNDNHHDDVQ